LLLNYFKGTTLCLGHHFNYHAFQAVKEVDKPEVVVTTSSNNGRVEIKVRDNGIGIPEDIKGQNLPAIFQYQADGSGNRSWIESQL